jgi:hypothetical protein
MQFQTTILQTGKTTTGIEVPAQIMEALNAGKHPKVRVTIKGYSYPSSIASMGGTFMISVSAEVRTKAGVNAGDTLEVEVVLDTAPREVVLPKDFADVLRQDTTALKFFEGLSYSNQRRIVLPIEDAKTPETRQRRIEKAISNLRDGKI